MASEEETLDDLVPSNSKDRSLLDRIVDDDEGDDLDAMVVNKSESRGLSKPWMKFHKFTLVKTVAEVRQIVDDAISHGTCGLDLETEGFDNRINYDDQGKPYTIHKIVGFCISVRSHGYYIPVRHNFDDFADKDPNVKPLADVESEISRLCWASQPILTEEGKATDPLGSSKIAVPPKVVIGFFLAKFDQEFLYPVTGLEIWHPESFECGHLAAFSIFSDDPDLGLKGKAETNLVIYDPDTLVEGKPKACPYEMIEFKELFEPGCKDRRFYNLYPTDNNEVTLYGCSDAICTELLCFPRSDWDFTREGLTYAYDTVVPKALGSKHAFTYRLEKQSVAAVRDMERQRAKINHPKIKALYERAEAELAKYDALIRDLAEKKGFKDFNAGSPQQLSEFLFEERGLNLSPKPERNEASKSYKTDASTLEKIAEEVDAPVLDWIVKHRQITKIMGTYLDSMSKNCDSQDCLRFKFNQTGAATGRFTAPAGEPDHGYAGIPIQGIPARSDPKKPEVAHSLRSAFVAREGYTLVKVDYAGQELRVVANISGEDLWIHEFLHGSGDLHTLTAQAFFGSHITKKDKNERNAGKIANFSLIYGGGTAAIMRATKCDKVEAARRKANFDKSVPTFASWVKGQHVRVKKNLGVSNAFGRFLAIPDATTKAGDLDAKGNPISEKDANRIRAACERKSTNYPIQGCYQAGALILTKEGWRRIETPGTCEVWTGTRWAGAVSKDMGPCDLAELQLKDGTTIPCDTRHKLLVVTDEGYSWVEYPDLKPGMAIATPLHEPIEFTAKSLPPIGHRTKARVKFRVSSEEVPELWYWLGRYYGDGWLDSRGALIYAFGSHDSPAVDRCVDYWKRLGFNPSVASAWKDTKQGRCLVYRVEVWSVDLLDWLGLLGVTPALAETKRLPLSVLNETLVNRKQFILGFMDSDGHKPRLPKDKLDRVNKGSPYNFHLCQRPLLVDLKLLLRTLGVESVIRGPYRSGSTKSGSSTTSYRLDLNRRMFDRHVLGVPNRGPKFNDMFVPKFLVDELVSYDFHRQAFGADESAAVLYYRLRVGGKVTVYAFKHLCQLLSVKLSQPIYGFKRLVSKKELPSKATTYTQSVNDSLHRFEAEGVIAKNSGADILKISLVRLLKEFHKRGWRRQGGDDSVRMIMTVHDEIVFEVKHERLAEAMPVIVEIMESPSKLTKWKVPLIVEPLIDLTWEAKYDWNNIMAGKDPVPEWLQGILVPNGNAPKEEGVEVPQVKEDPQPKSLEAAKPPVSPTIPPPSETSPIGPSTISPTAGTIQVATFTLAYMFLPERTAKLAFEATLLSINPESNTYLRLVDLAGNVLIDPASRKFRIDPDVMRLRMIDRNLGTGEYELREVAL